MLRFVLVLNRQGKLRLAKYYVPCSESEKADLPIEVHRLIATRDQRSQSNFVEVCLCCLTPASLQQDCVPTVCGSIFLRICGHVGQ